MEVLKSKVLASNGEENYLVAEIVDNVSEQERQEFEAYEMIMEEDLTKEEKEKLSELIKKYLKSYSKNKDKMSLNEWLLMMFREDFPELTEEKILEMADTTVNSVENNYRILKEVKRNSEIGLNPSDYFASEIMEDEEFKNLENRVEILENVNESLTQEGIINISQAAYSTIEEDNSSKNLDTTGKVLAKKTIDDYFFNIDKTLETANEKMQETIHNLDGTINMNKNLHGFISEQHHANTFNIDAATKDIKDVVAEVLVPNGKRYGKNSVDIVIKEIKKGKTYIVKKYQVKFYKDANSTAKAFYDKYSEHRYPFQGKLVPAEQMEKIKNAFNRISYKKVNSKPLPYEESTFKAKEVQNGNESIVNVNFKNDVKSIELLKTIGKKSVRNTVLAGVTFATLNIGKKLVTEEEIKVDEVVVDAIKAGGSIGITTAISGALTAAAKKEIIKGSLANSNVISTIAFSTVECITSLYKMGTGEYSFENGMDSIGENLTAGFVASKGFVLGTSAGVMVAGQLATLGGMMATSALVTTVAGVVGGTLLAMAGATMAGAVYNGAKTMIKNTVTSARVAVAKGRETIKNIASCAWETTKSVASSIVSRAGSALTKIFG